MRRIIQLIAAAAIVVCTLAAATLPSAAEDRGRDRRWKPRTNIVETVVAASGASGFDSNGHDYDILRDAVIAAGLADELSAGRWTVFAPNDRAFLRLVDELTGTPPESEQAAFDAVAAVAGSALPEILLYHVVAGVELGPLQVLLSRELTMSNSVGDTTVGVRGVRLVDADPDLRDARLLVPASNIKASNGVIHTIDRVLLPIDVDL